jgi:hypothetical protein
VKEIPMPPVAVLLLLAAAEPAVPEQVRKDLFFLAGDECEGRGLETEGIRKAAAHIADTFRKAGLAPGGTDGYFQPFPVYTGRAVRGKANALTVKPLDGPARVAELDRDYVPLWGTADLDAGVAFAGHGIVAPKLNHDDYADLDVAGKWVMVLRRTPRHDDADRPFDPAPDSPFGTLSHKLQQALARKAAGVIFVNDVSFGKAGDDFLEPGVLAGVQPPLPAEFPVVHVKRAFAERLLGKPLADIEQAVAGTGKSAATPLAWTADAAVAFSRPSIPCKNVIGVLEGNGPLADETVVVGAHYDHLGRGEGGRMASRDTNPTGKVHFGADDNASGTTGLLELARRLGAAKDRAGRRIVFVAFSGEERGLFGSLHYCAEPTFPLSKTVFMLNMDMIGRASPGAEPKDGKDRLVVYGTGSGTGLDAAAERFNPGFNLIKVPTGSGPSDHESFFLKKIPVLFLFTGTHRDYHTPTDTPDKVNLPGLMKAVDYAERLTSHFAAVPDRPQFQATSGGWFDPTEDKPRRPTRGGGPKMGIMPGNYESDAGGVLVEDVVPGGAAERAGLKKGDRIVAIAGKPVKDINQYMTAMAAQKAGVEIEVEVVRGEKKEAIKVTPK